MRIDGKEYISLHVSMVKHETQPGYTEHGAVFVDFEGTEYCIPKSTLEDWPDVGDGGEILIAEWMAVQKGMV